MAPNRNRHLTPDLALHMWGWMQMLKILWGFKQKTLYQFGPPNYISSDKGTHFVFNSGERCHTEWTYHVAHCPLSNGLIDNWHRQLKHLLSKMGGDKGMKGWPAHLHECVFTFYMRRLKGGSRLDRFLCSSGTSGEKGIEMDAGMRTVVFIFFPTSP